MKIKKFKESVELKEADVEEVENPQVKAAADSIDAEEVITPEENKGMIFNILHNSFETLISVQIITQVQQV